MTDESWRAQRGWSREARKRPRRSAVLDLIRTRVDRLNGEEADTSNHSSHLKDGKRRDVREVTKVAGDGRKLSSHSRNVATSGAHSACMTTSNNANDNVTRCGHGQFWTGAKVVQVRSAISSRICDDVSETARESPRGMRTHTKYRFSCAPDQLRRNMRTRRRTRSVISASALAIRRLSISAGVSFIAAMILARLAFSQTYHQRQTIMATSSTA